MEGLFGTDSFLAPQLSIAVQAFFRIGYGILLFGSLMWALPGWKRFFRSERWGGYAKSSPDVDLLQNPVSSALIGVTWFACATALIVDFHPVLASFISLVIARYYHVHMRWKGVARGMGAPGLMTYWLALLFSCSSSPVILRRVAARWRS